MNSLRDWGILLIVAGLSVLLYVVLEGRLNNVWIALIIAMVGFFIGKRTKSSQKRRSY